MDEVLSLKHLPILSSTLVEARKYGVRMVLGTQNKTQFEEHYGRGAATMLASSHTKILFRCNEPESARWVSEMIGEEEKERPRIGTTATVQANGRDSINYSTFTERRLVVSKEQIMALPNLHGYWKYADSVVPFRIEPKDRPRIGTTATVDANGRDSINYSTFTERRLVVSKEQIMSLPNLHGYWKYGDSVVPFRIEPIDRP